MSLVKTLAKVAIGIAVAKGLGTLVTGSEARPQPSPPRDGTVGRGTPYDGPLSQGSGSGGGLIDALGKVLGGAGPRDRGSLGSSLDELSRLSRPGGSSLGHATAPHDRFGTPESGSLGDLLDQSLQRYGEPEAKPSRAQEELAGLLLRALIQAAKADGQIDPAEKKQLMERLGNLDREEVEFVNRELGRPVDARALARDVPKGAEQQVYMMSAMGIDLDTRQEARYLQELAGALGVNAATANAIHDRIGEPRVFR